MFKAQVTLMEDLMDENRTLIIGRGHGMAKTAYKAKREALRMANADIGRKSICGGVPVLEMVEVTNTRTREMTVTY